MKGLIILIFGALFGFHSTANGQTFRENFEAAVQEKDTIAQREILDKWERKSPNDAELYTSLFNYYFNRARREVVTVNADKPSGEALELRDSLNQIAGYMGSEIIYDSEILDTALAKIQSGIDAYPDRLDMRFGKIYALGETENWNRYTDEIIRVVDRSDENDNAWTWTGNEPKPGAKDFMLSVFQDYQLKLYHTGDDSLLINMRQIANRILKSYPDQVKSLSNLSVTHLLLGEYDKGIEALLKAEKINPKDPVVLSNIAHGYKMKGDKEKAIAYYKKIMAFGNAQEVSRAQEEIVKLKTE